MAQVDASIYGQLAQPANPLDMVSQFTDYQKAVNANKLLQMQIQTQQGEGAAAQAGINQDGTVDPAKIGQALKAGSPLAATAGIPLLQGAQAQQQAIQAQILKNRKDATDYLGTQFGAYLDRNQGPASTQDAVKIVTDGLSAGTVTPEVAATALRQIYGTNNDSQKLRNVLAGGFLTALGAPGQAAQVTGPPAANAAPTVVPQGAAVAKELGAGAPGTTGGAPTATAPGPMVVGTPPGQSEAMAVGAAGASNAAVAMSNAANRLNQGQADLANMMELSGKFTGGPMSDDIRTAITAFNEVTGMGIKIPSIASQEEFNKIASQIVLNQASAYHASDLSTETAMKANPSGSLSNLGIKRIGAMLMGNNDAIILKDEMWHDWLEQHPGQDGKFYDWSRQFNKQFDPRIFQIEHMLNPDGTPNQDAIDMVKDMKKSGQYDKFKQNFIYATQQHWIPDHSKDWSATGGQ